MLVRKSYTPVVSIANTYGIGYPHDGRPVYIQNMACVVTNEDMCSFGYLSVVHHRMRQTSSIALNERLKQTKRYK